MASSAWTLFTGRRFGGREFISLKWNGCRSTFMQKITTNPVPADFYETKYANLQNEWLKENSLLQFQKDYKVDSPVLRSVVLKMWFLNQQH